MTGWTMAAQPNFTADRVDGFTCPPGKSQAIYWDGKTPGLGMRVSSGGGKSYIFQARVRGRTVRATIGDVATWTVKAAQVEATRLKTLTDQGTDPRELAADEAEQRTRAAEEKAIAERRQSVTVGEAWQAYVEDRERAVRPDDRKKPLWGPRHRANLAKLVQAGGAKRTRGLRPGEPDTVQPGPLYQLLSLKLAALDGNAVRTWLARETQRAGAQTAQAYRALRAFHRWCGEHDEYRHVAVPGATEEGKTRRAVPKPGAKRDCLELGHLPAWFAAVRALRNPVHSAYLQCLLLIGSRREELAGLRWADVDFRQHSLTIHDKVSAATRTIPLTPYVAGLLASLKAINAAPRVRPLRRTAPAEPHKPSPWVFFSNKAGGGRIAEPRIAHVKALTAAGLPHVSLHGLRRSFASLSEWEAEIPVGVVAQIMGHKPSATAERHYKVRPVAQLRPWHDKIEGTLLAAAGIEQPKREAAQAPALAAVLKVTAT